LLTTMPRLTLLLISLWLGSAQAQTAAPAAPNSTTPATPAAAAPKADAPKADAPKADAPKADTPKADTPKADAPKADTPKADAKSEPPKAQAAQSDPAAAPAPAPKPGKKGKEEPPPPPPVKTGPFKPPGCAVAEFRAIAIDNPDEKTRRTKAIAWLKKKAPDCSAEQLIVMRNNREQWLGSADSATIAAMIDGLLESFAETNREVAILLYGTPPPPPKPDEKGAAKKGADKK